MDAQIYKTHRSACQNDIQMHRFTGHRFMDGQIYGCRLTRHTYLHAKRIYRCTDLQDTHIYGCKDLQDKQIYMAKDLQMHRFTRHIDLWMNRFKKHKFTSQIYKTHSFARHTDLWMHRLTCHTDMSAIQLCKKYRFTRFINITGKIIYMTYFQAYRYTR